MLPCFLGLCREQSIQPCQRSRDSAGLGFLASARLVDVVSVMQYSGERKLLYDLSGI